MASSWASRIGWGVVFVLTLLFGLNGSYMLVAPEAWYWLVPGVSDTGPFNQHFIRDIGFIYLLSALGLVAGVWWPEQRMGLWSLVAGWQVLHALFHIWEVVVGICGPEALARDFLGVSLPALLMLALVYRHWRHSRVKAR